MKRNYIIAFLFVALCLSVGYLSSLLSGSASFKSTYFQLQKPSFAPPAWVFGPVWTILYILMGIAAFLVWEQKEKKNVSRAFVFFSIQLILNFLWSIIFFGMHNYFGAFVEIVVLLFFIILTLIEFYKISKTASYLLIPYALWVSFAAILNFTVWSIN